MSVNNFYAMKEKSVSICPHQHAKSYNSNGEWSYNRGSWKSAGLYDWVSLVLSGQRSWWRSIMKCCCMHLVTVRLFGPTCTCSPATTTMKEPWSSCSIMDTANKHSTQQQQQQLRVKGQSVYVDIRVSFILQPARSPTHLAQSCHKRALRVYFHPSETSPMILF